jgi:hypothetical protein
VTSLIARPLNSIVNHQCLITGLELSKIEILKMLDLETQSAIDSDNLQVQH